MDGDQSNYDTVELEINQPLNPKKKPILEIVPKTPGCIAEWSKTRSRSGEALGSNLTQAITIYPDRFE